MQKKFSTTDIIVFVFLTGYFLISSAAITTIKDQMGLHWLLLSILNLLAGIYIIKDRKDFLGLPINLVFKNAISIFYFTFFILAGFSLYFAINKVEGFVIYSRLITTVMCFCSVAFLLNRRLHLLKNFTIVIAVLLLVKSYGAISQFYAGLGKVSLSDLISGLQNSEGNKNIFAATIAVQIPFIIYGIFVHKKIWKYLCVFSLGLAVFTLIIVNARASYLAVLLEFFLLFVGIFIIHFRDKSIKTIYKNLGIILLTFAIAFFASQRTLKKAALMDSSSVYGTLGNRLSTITDTENATTNIRLTYWNTIIKAIKEKPITGVGYGNWKLYSTKYMNIVLDDNVFSKHPHNDFLEIAAETGVINSFIYFLIFVAAFFTIVNILFSRRSVEIKYISLFSFIGLSGYLIDACFNFPLERPHMQMLFVFTIVILILSFTNEKAVLIGEKKITKLNFLIPVLIVFLSVSTTYGSYKVFQSMKAQFVVDNDLNSIDGKSEAMPQYKYEEVKKMFPSFPNIAENSEPIGFKLAKYLGKEKRYAEAFKVLDSVHKFSPNLGYDYFLKCNLYQEMGKNDSAYVYSKKAYYTKPRQLYYYKTATYLARLKKDTTEINKMFKLYSSYRKDDASYSYYVESLARSYYDIPKLKIIVNKGLMLYPKNKELAEFKDYIAKMEQYNAQRK